MKSLQAAAMLLAMYAMPAYSEIIERVVWGEVTHVAPLTRPVSIIPASHCTTHRPDSRDLAELLAWDLDPACVATTNSETVGYRVTYMWDGRHYTMRTTEHPGARVPLRLRLR